MARPRIDLPPLQPEITKEQWQRDVAAFERAVLFDNLRGPPCDARLATLRAAAAQGGFDGNALTMFDAVTDHEIADEYRDGFLNELKKRAGGDTTLAALQPEAIADAFDTYNAAQDAATAPALLETRAATRYRAAQAGTEWPLERMRREDARTLQSDLEYLRALRIRNPEERNRAFDAIEADLAARILGEQHFGVRAEHQVTWLIRRWARDMDAAHRIVITHALPKDDYDRGTDLVLDIGSRRFSINLKTLNVDNSNTEEHQQAILEKGGAKAAAANAHLVTMPSDTLRTAWRLATQSKLDDTERRKFRRLQQEFFAAFDESDIPLTDCFRPPERPTKRERAPRALTDVQLTKLVTAAVLQTFDCITSEALANPTMYMHIQQRFIRAAKGRIMRAEDLLHPSDDLKKEIRQAMES